MNKNIKNKFTKNDIDQLVNKVLNGKISFPYGRLYSKETKILFENLKSEFTDLKIDDQTPFDLDSYKTKYNLYIPPLFRNKPVRIFGDPNLHLEVDIISDHFNEEQHIRAKHARENKSIWDFWNDSKIVEKIIRLSLNKYGNIEPYNLRESIYQIIKLDVNIFNPTWAKTILKVVFEKSKDSFESFDSFESLKWLDISAGWGDRLITAISLNMEYLGFDPNTNLKPGHKSMIKMFGDKNKQKVIYEPFEIQEFQEEYYDVVFSSPPYFDLEIYTDIEGQSIQSYSNYNSWMVNFLFRSLFKAWNALKIGGFLILHLGDSINLDGTDLILAEPTNLYIENYLLGSSFEGVIGLVGGFRGKARPVWVYKKVDRLENRLVWQNNENLNEEILNNEILNNENKDFKDFKNYKFRTLTNTYPELQKEIIKYYIKNLENNKIKTSNSEIKFEDIETINKFIILNEAEKYINLEDIKYILSCFNIKKSIKYIKLLIDLIYPYK